MTIDFSPLNFSFSKKPLIFGGKAMEYYGLRKSGLDVDIIVTPADLKKLIRMYPKNIKDIWGDLGIAVYDFEIWKTINYYDYEFFSAGAIEKSDYLIISIEKLLFQKAMAIHILKHREDLEQITKYIIETQSKKTQEMFIENNKILDKIENIHYLEKKGA